MRKYLEEEREKRVEKGEKDWEMSNRLNNDYLILEVIFYKLITL